jgi:hypothetical protein
MNRLPSVGLLLASLLMLALSACSDSSSPTPTATVAAQPSAAASPSTQASPTVSAPPVPAKYQTAYGELDAALTNFESTLPANAPPVTQTGGVASTSLIQANSNLGPAVLTPANMQSIQSYLDDIKKLGVGAVEVQVSYPVPSAGVAQEESYYSFYKSVVDEAHQRGIKVLIETSCIFADSPFTQVQFDFAKLTTAAYFQGRQDVILRLATEAKPDFISMGEEPVNEKVFAGIQYSDAEYIAFLNATAAAVRATDSPTQIGAGTGTWEAALFRNFVDQTDLDFYNIHIYPLQAPNNGLQVAQTMATYAGSQGKPVIVGETWLYKMSASEIGVTAGATAAVAFSRDAYTFWEPLDARYLRDVLALGAEFDMQLVSLWGARYFYGQLDWTEELDALDFRGTSQKVNPLISQGINADELSALGEAFAALMNC